MELERLVISSDEPFPQAHRKIFPLKCVRPSLRRLEFLRAK